MIFVLIRHGHKSMSPPEDPSLSDTGFEQAHKLLEFVQKGVLPEPTICLFSDKIRTKQTLQEILDFYKPKQEAKTEISVRSQSETAAQFRQRVQKIINYYTFFATQSAHQKQVVYLCTHYDWIEESMTLIDCNITLNSYEFAAWAPAQFVQFEISDDGLWAFVARGVTSV